MQSKEDAADTWLGVAIGGYVAAGALVVTGIIVSATYDSSPEGKGVTVLPSAGPGGIGLQLVGRF